MLVVPLLIPVVALVVVGGRAAARRRGLIERPFSRSSDGVVGAVAGGLGGIGAVVFTGSESPGPGRWFGLYLLIGMAVVDLVERARWRRSAGPSG